MKYILFLLLFSCNSILAQVAGISKSDEDLGNMEKEYLSNLVQLNTGNIIRFYAHYDSSELKDYEELITSKIKNIEIGEAINLPFEIQKECSSASIKANAFFIKLKEPISNKNGSGEFSPNKVTLTYKWSIQKNILIFIFTDRELNSSFQKYINLPTNAGSG